MDYIRRGHEWLAENTNFVQFPRERRETPSPTAWPWHIRLLVGYLGLLTLLFCCVAAVFLGAFFAAVLF